MSRLMLVIGTKRYSSWSLRAWLALKQARLSFDEVSIPLYQPDTKQKILEHSPSGRVPLLKDGSLRIWESLAICEYVAEIACAVPLWPENRGTRAVARAVAAEMHSGFPALRENLPMDVLADRSLTATAAAAASDDIARILEIWNTVRARYGAGGEFLFGRWSIADAMFAPVAIRFKTYGVPLDPVSAAYVKASYGLPALQEWIADVVK